MTTIYYIDGVKHEAPSGYNEELERQKTIDYWTKTPENILIVNEIRKKYDINAEFAILRQQKEKPEEYEIYYSYCEECKEYVKSKKGMCG
jgi:hypothetical protein